MKKLKTGDIFFISRKENVEKVVVLGEIGVGEIILMLSENGETFESTEEEILESVIPEMAIPLIFIIGYISLLIGWIALLTHLIWSVL